MFCVHCGKELAEGEVCECEKNKIVFWKKGEITEAAEEKMQLEKGQNKQNHVVSMPENKSIAYEDSNQMYFEERIIDVEVHDKSVKPKRRRIIRKIMFILSVILTLLSYVIIQVVGMIKFRDDKVMQLILPYISVLIPVIFAFVAMSILVSFIERKIWKEIIHVGLLVLLLLFVSKLGISFFVEEKIPIKIEDNLVAEQEQEKLIEEIEELTKKSDYLSVINLLKGNAFVENNDQMQDMLEDSMEKYQNQILEEVSLYAADGDYISASALLDVAIGVLGKNEVFDAKYTEIKKYEILAKIKELDQEEKYADIISYIDDNQKVINNDPDILVELSKAIQNYKEFVVKEAENANTSEGYEAAIKIINEGLTVLSDDELLLKEKSLYEEMVPVKLTDLSPYVGKLSINENYSDNMGNVYSVAVVGYSTCDTAVYDIGKEYNVLKATVAVTYEPNANSNIRGCIRIYGDERLLWEDTQIINSTKPYPIEVDITGVTDLKIEVEGYGYWAGALRVILAEPILQKTTK